VTEENTQMDKDRDANTSSPTIDNREGSEQIQKQKKPKSMALTPTN